MVKTRIYILTYNSAVRINACLDHLISSDIDDECQIFIINNHSNFTIQEKFKDKVKLLHNVLQPDFSTGHMSRNWNQAIVNGFENLKSPACDIVVTMQDDTIVHDNWYSELKKAHFKKGYSFVQSGHGDSVCSYLPSAVKKVGLWDERFTMGFQAADYFYRQLMFNWNDCTINDQHHHRIHNPCDLNIVKHYRVAEHNNDENFINNEFRWIDSNIDLSIGSKLLENKYDSDIWPWTNDIKEKAKTASFKINNFISYSYFEKDVELNNKNYLI